MSIFSNPGVGILYSPSTWIPGLICERDFGGVGTRLRGHRHLQWHILEHSLHGMLCEAFDKKEDLGSSMIGRFELRL